VRRKWEAALDEMATLDFEGERISFADALSAIEGIAEDTLFAPESRNAPVQVMGPLESAGSTFDAIWFLQASDLAWPKVVSPSPLLPWTLQRELGMPGTDPTLDLERAKRMTQRIAGAAPCVVFSHAREDAEGRLRPSPALNGLRCELRDAIDLSARAEPAARVRLESIVDVGPIPPPGGVLTGGAAILQAQAACGFKAFAERRLFSTALETPSLGLDARQRGNLVHSVLEKFWSEVKTQTRLKSMTEQDRTAELDRAIESVFSRDYARTGPGWPVTYLGAERQRLKNLLLPWLQFEATERGAFSVKSSERKLEDVSIGDLRLTVRVDRIDEVDVEPADGGLPLSVSLIVDYKTGDAKPAQWLTDRPDEPQLPLYAIVAGEQDLGGLAFAVIRPGKEMAMRGYEAHAGVLPKAAPSQTGSFDEQLDAWRTVLTQLAHDFYTGQASVSPKNYPATCKFCEQRILCRLDVASLDLDAASDAAGAEIGESEIA
jgi:ATP-dependent helicase/nuclease subunit B